MNNQNRREIAIERMADHVLSHGIGAATLRPLAAAAGTSNRMLLYYFADKDELLTATLNRVATRMIVQLENAIPSESPKPAAALLEQIVAALTTDSLQPFMHLWLDLVSGAARGLQPHCDVAGQISDRLLAWLTIRLQPEKGGEASSFAPLLHASIAGISLLRAAGRSTDAAAAASKLALLSK
jgi:AcrR family transcriptional regulator